MTRRAVPLSAVGTMAWDKRDHHAAARLGDTRLRLLPLFVYAVDSFFLLVCWAFRELMHCEIPSFVFL